jgi:hypothetical protein
MLAEDLALSRDEQQCAVHGAGGDRVELGDTDGDVTSCGSRGGTQLIRLRTRDRHGSAEV